jgi:alpha-ketoglutarate-dependent 2,4-dichlorophenoxyacetate dioxygenase
MEVIPIGPGFAAELRGIGMMDVVTNDDAYRAARAAFEQHSVILLRGQEIADDVQVAFSRAFGPLELGKVGLQSAGTFYGRITNLNKDGTLARLPDERQLQVVRANQLWHTDSSFLVKPALASVLSARTVPPEGGETEFCSTRLAWERLSPERQAKLRDLIVEHSYHYSRDQIDPHLMSPEQRQAMPPVKWRMTWRNPYVDRSSFYIASHAGAIEGMGDNEAKALLAELTAEATAPGRTYLHHWRDGDVVMWDNRATMHRGRPWSYDKVRLMIRTTIKATEADGLAEVRPPPRLAA